MRSVDSAPKTQARDALAQQEAIGKAVTRGRRQALADVLKRLGLPPAASPEDAIDTIAGRAVPSYGMTADKALGYRQALADVLARLGLEGVASGANGAEDAIERIAAFAKAPKS